MSCFIFLFISAELSCPYQRTDNAYPRYLDTIVNNVKNEVACEVACTFHEQFVCRSFAFYASASQCFLSGDDKGNLANLMVRNLTNDRRFSIQLSYQI